MIWARLRRPHFTCGSCAHLLCMCRGLTPMRLIFPTMPTATRLRACWKLMSSRQTSRFRKIPPCNWPKCCGRWRAHGTAPQPACCAKLKARLPMPDWALLCRQWRWVWGRAKAALALFNISTTRLGCHRLRVGISGKAKDAMPWGVQTA